MLNMKYVAGNLAKNTPHGSALGGGWAYISMLVFGGVHSDIVCLSWISESARFHVEAEPEGWILGDEFPLSEWYLWGNSHRHDGWRDDTLPETNIFASENRPGPKRKVYSIPIIIFQGRAVSFRDDILEYLSSTFPTFFLGGWVPSRG